MKRTTKQESAIFEIIGMYLANMRKARTHGQEQGARQFGHRRVVLARRIAKVSKADTDSPNDDFSPLPQGRKISKATAKPPLSDNATHMHARHTHITHNTHYAYIICAHNTGEHAHDEPMLHMYI